MMFSRNMLCLFACVVLICSCGEDRTYEYEEKTIHNQWLFSEMREWYLWGDSLKEPDWKSYFGQPKDFFKKLTTQRGISDAWSYCEYDTVVADEHERGYFNHVNSYGMDYVVMTDPTGSTTRSYVRVTYVVPGSPADLCGLVRNSFIGVVDGARVNSGKADVLKNGRSHSLVVGTLGYNEDSTALVWEREDTVSLDASAYVEEKAFPVAKVLETEGMRFGYVMCNRLCEYPEESGNRSSSYADDMERIFGEMKSAAPDEFVLDLRLCNYGTMEMARKLASKLVGGDCLGGVFARTVWNSRKSANNTDVLYETSVTNHIGLQRVFIITSNYTQGAAEWLINSLRSAMGEENVITVGVRTAGQNVMLGDVPSDYNVTLHPAVAFVANPAGNYGYSSGIVPDWEVNEFENVELYPYGDEREVLLRTIINAVMASM